jgi:hypothetical protein
MFYANLTDFSDLLNFVRPDPVLFPAFSHVKGAQIFLLKPGDVLHVPGEWWHWVFSMNDSLAINYWTTEPQGGFPDSHGGTKPSVVKAGAWLPMDKWNNLTDNQIAALIDTMDHDARGPGLMVCCSLHKHLYPEDCMRHMWQPLPPDYSHESERQPDWNWDESPISVTEGEYYLGLSGMAAALQRSKDYPHHNCMALHHNLSPNSTFMTELDSLPPWLRRNVCKHCDPSKQLRSIYANLWWSRGVHTTGLHYDKTMFNSLIQLKGESTALSVEAV